MQLDPGQQVIFLMLVKAGMRRVIVAGREMYDIENVDTDAILKHGDEWEKEAKNIVIQGD